MKYLVILMVLFPLIVFAQDPAPKRNTQGPGNTLGPGVAQSPNPSPSSDTSPGRLTVSEYLELQKTNHDTYMTSFQLLDESVTKHERLLYGLLILGFVNLIFLIAITIKVFGITTKNQGLMK